ncbi:MAG: hypothetical protein AMXMBFR58_28370 [Phycisphaerae bacterium]|nr:hypothetical protein [Phycisphaerales bacterium]
MASSFNGVDLFGSGPHRFSVSSRGQLLVRDLDLGGLSPKSHPVGLLELEVVVRGRLVAASNSALWTIRDAITAQLQDPPVMGTLVDHTGRGYTDMSFVLYTEDRRTDRGRVHSIAYAARFRRLIP